MPKASPYPLELKLKVVREYDEGVAGYKALASKYSLDRDLVRSWCANAKLRPDKKIPYKEETFSGEEKNLAYYRDAAAYWEEYAHQLEDQLRELGVLKL